MKIFCHPDFTNSLKLLIAKEVGNVANVALESVHPDTKVVPYLSSPTLPVLQLDGGEVRKKCMVCSMMPMVLSMRFIFICRHFSVTHS